MTQAAPTPRLTYDDYCNTPDDERWELIDGELFMAPSPTTRHQVVLLQLFRPLADFVDAATLGTVFVAPLDVVLSDTSVLQPDIIFISTARTHIITQANIQGAPDLVVEVLSPSTAARDWRAKHDLYSQHGIREYWIVDTDAQRIWVMSRPDDAPNDPLNEVANYGPASALTSPLLPGFTLNLSQVFSHIHTGQAN